MIRGLLLATITALAGALLGFGLATLAGDAAPIPSPQVVFPAAGALLGLLSGAVVHLNRRGARDDTPAPRPAPRAARTPSAQESLAPSAPPAPSASHEPPVPSEPSEPSEPIVTPRSAAHAAPEGIESVNDMLTALGGELSEAVEFEELIEPAAPTASTAPARGSLFADMDNNPLSVRVEQDAYTPSFNSLMFNLADMERQGAAQREDAPEAPDALEVPDAPEEAGLSFASFADAMGTPDAPPDLPSPADRVQSGRTLGQVAQTSPFGAGEPGEPGRFEVDGLDGQLSLDALASMMGAPDLQESSDYMSDPLPVPRAQTLPQPAGFDEDPRTRPKLQLTRTLASSMLDADEPASSPPALRTTPERHMTPRRATPNDLLQLSVRSSAFDEVVLTEDDIQRLYQEFIMALRSCGRSGVVVEYEAFSDKIRQRRERVRQRHGVHHLDMEVLIQDGKPRIEIRPS